MVGEWVRLLVAGRMDLTDSTGYSLSSLLPPPPHHHPFSLTTTHPSLSPHTTTHPSHLECLGRVGRLLPPLQLLGLTHQGLPVRLIHARSGAGDAVPLLLLHRRAQLRVGEQVHGDAGGGG